MKPTTKDLLKLVDAIAPFELAEEWDNSGLQVGNRDWPAGKVLVSLDVTAEVMADAASWGADIVLTHHPLMIRPQRSFDFGSMPGAVVALAAANRISIISAHTNLDRALGGLNDHFAQKLGLVGVSQIQPSIPGNGETTPELGRIGGLDQPMPLFEFADRIKSSLGISGLRVVGNKELVVKKAAVCTGSGASLVQAFLGSGADVFITGDMKYHEARDIEQAGLALIDVGHFASEHIVVELLVQRLVSSAETAGFEIDVRGFDGETDPFIMV